MTGIIDGKGLGLRPAMSPRIVNQSGSVVYGRGSTAGTMPPAMVCGRICKISRAGQGRSEGAGKPPGDQGLFSVRIICSDLVVSNIDAGKIARADGSAGL